MYQIQRRAAERVSAEDENGLDISSGHRANNPVTVIRSDGELLKLVNGYFFKGCDISSSALFLCDVKAGNCVIKDDHAVEGSYAFSSNYAIACK